MTQSINYETEKKYLRQIFNQIPEVSSQEIVADIRKNLYLLEEQNSKLKPERGQFEVKQYFGLHPEDTFSHQLNVKQHFLLAFWIWAGVLLPSMFWFLKRISSRHA